MEYKNIKDTDSWDDEEEGTKWCIAIQPVTNQKQTNHQQSTYDLRTPLKKSRNITMISEDDSGTEANNVERRPSLHQIFLLKIFPNNL